MNKQPISNRIVVLDTETTGLNPQEGHRIIEIGCVELVKRRLTGKRFHGRRAHAHDIGDGAGSSISKPTVSYTRRFIVFGQSGHSIGD